MTPRTKRKRSALQLATTATLILCMHIPFVAAAQNEGINNKSVNGKNGQELGERKLNGKTLEEQYGGLVMDQTITVAGQDFYQYFVALWREKPFHERFAISVRELPSARWGNQILVEYEHRRVFQSVLPPNRSNIKAISESAVEISYQNVVNADIQRLLFRDEDIGPDEM